MRAKINLWRGRIVGAWGYNPIDNDFTWDCLYEIEKAGIKSLKKLFSKKVRDTDDRWARVGVLFYLMNEYKWSVPLSTAKKALDDLLWIKEDDEWIDGWRSKNLIIRSLNKYIKNLQKKIAEAQKYKNKEIYP